MTVHLAHTDSILSCLTAYDLSCASLGATKELELSAAAMVRSTGRQTESHEEGSASAPLTLTDMLHIVPSMFETMSSDARQILLTVNQAFRKHMHETADLVVADWRDVPLIVKGNWVCLQSLSLTDDSGSRRSMLQSGDSPAPVLQQVHWPCLKHEPVRVAAKQYLNVSAA